MYCPDKIIISLLKCGWVPTNNRWRYVGTKEVVGWWDAVCIQMERNITSKSTQTEEVGDLKHFFQQVI